MIHEVRYQFPLFENIEERSCEPAKLGYEPNLKPKGEQLLSQESPPLLRLRWIKGLVAQVVRALH